MGFNLRLFGLFTLFFAMGSLSWAAESVVGVILEEGTDRTVPYAEIRYTSGKVIGSADRRGRFELQVDRRDAILQVIRPGYDTARIELQDYGDLLDVVISLKSSVRELGQTKVRGRQTPSWQALREIPLGKLEDAAGLRFDLAEHLSQLPGMSGQRDFSSALSYDGSRSQEVAYHLGGLRIPNMRHLDVGFPGNLSVVNPHVLRGIEVHDQYGDGPLQQGVASAVRFVPDPGTEDEFGLRASFGTTVREFYATGPWLFWDAFVISFRWLDPAMLKNMGEKFFTEFRKRDASCTDCNIQSSDAFDLSSKDFYLRLSGSDSSGSRWGMGTIVSRDEFAIRQDTSSDLGSVNSATLVQGHQNYNVAFLDYSGSGGTSVHLGWIAESRGDTLRDTSGFRSNEETAGNEAYRNFIDGGTRQKDEYRIGADGITPWTPAGSSLQWAVDYAHVREERTYADSGRVLRRNMNYNDIELLGRLVWKRPQWRLSTGAGAATVLDHHSPLFSIDGERKLQVVDHSRIFGNVAWRADPQVTSESSQLQRDLSQGLSAKLGVGYDHKGISARLHGFGRWYPSPDLPTPVALWHYQELGSADYAWVSGASTTLEYRTLHHFALQSNASSVYGEYELQGGSSMPWNANVRLDVVTHMRIYPRRDSLISMIVTHHAAWHRPLYQWDIGSHTRTTRSSDQSTDLFRTDVRVNLDLSSSWKPLEDVRFYVEVNNIFEPIDVSWLRFLGAENARERSLVTEDDDDNSLNGYRLVPFLAKGMGLYAQFGVEGSLGF